MWDFEHGEAGSRLRNLLHPSFGLRPLLGGRERDIGIIPAAAYTEIPGLQVLPDVAIASRRAVRSILLVSKVPIERCVPWHWILRP